MIQSDDDKGHGANETHHDQRIGQRGEQGRANTTTTVDIPHGVGFGHGVGTLCSCFIRIHHANRQSRENHGQHHRLTNGVVGRRRV